MRSLIMFAKWGGFAAMVGCVSAVFVVGYFYVMESPYFKINGVEIFGCAKVNRMELLKKIGVDNDTNILELNLGEARSTVEAMPWVERVSIRRKLPDRLVVTIWEREPWALIHLDHLYYLDRNGTPFKRIIPGDDMNFPVITGISKELYFQDSFRSKEIVERVLRVMELLAANRGPFDLSQVSEINVDKGDAVTIMVNRGHLKIRLGTSLFEEKFHRLNVIRKNLAEKNRWQRVNYIDMDLGDRVVVS